MGPEGRLVGEGMSGWGSMDHTIKCLQLIDMGCVCVCVRASNGLCMQGVSTPFVSLGRACMLLSLCVGM